MMCTAAHPVPCPTRALTPHPHPPTHLVGAFNGSPSSSLLPERERALLGSGAQSPETDIAPDASSSADGAALAGARKGSQEPRHSPGWDPDAPQGPAPQQTALSQAPAMLLERKERAGMGATSRCPHQPKEEKPCCKTRRKKFGSICCSLETRGQRGQDAPQA